MDYFQIDNGAVVLFLFRSMSRLSKKNTRKVFFNLLDYFSIMRRIINLCDVKFYMRLKNKENILKKRPIKIISISQTFRDHEKMIMALNEAVRNHN